MGGLTGLAAGTCFLKVFLANFNLLAEGVVRGNAAYKQRPDKLLQQTEDISRARGGGQVSLRVHAVCVCAVCVCAVCGIGSVFVRERVPVKQRGQVPNRSLIRSAMQKG